MSENRALIVTYHAICEGPPPLCQAPSQLEEQLDLLAAAGFHAVSLSQVVDALIEGRALPQHAFALTFDDAYRDFADVALPILEKRQVPATLFTTASSERRHLPGGIEAALIPLERLSELAEREIEIGGHSVGHTDLTTLTDVDLEHELAQCREVLESHCGRAVDHFAYPFGRYDARVHAAVGRVFRSACTTELARVAAGADPLAIPRVDAHYLGSPVLRGLLRGDRPDFYLRVRRQLRQWRGSEPVVRLRTACSSPVSFGGLAPCR